MSKDIKLLKNELNQDFINYVKNDPLLGNDLVEALDRKASISIRCNNNKIFDINLLPISSKVPWTLNSYYLLERPSFVFDPFFHLGAYYSQDSGSMYLEKVLNELNINKNSIVLDLCAAPGGKSQILSTYLDENALLISNEIISSRVNILKENIVKWGCNNTIVSNNKAEDFKSLNNYFDLILADLPCSGEGLFRKDTKSRNEWSKNLIQFCASRQRKIVMDIWDSLKPGAFFIYSTCTFNQFENEENVNWIINKTGAEHISINHNELQTGRNNIGFYALPSKCEAEGIFFAILKKKSEINYKEKKYNQKANFTLFKNRDIINNYINQDISVYQSSNKLFAINQYRIKEIECLMNYLNIKKIGTFLGEIIKNKIIPSHDLSMDISSLNENILKIKISKEEALQYLKGNSFNIDVKNGFQLFSYEDLPLGWINKLDNRFNNLYPKEWRIRKQI